MKRLLKFGSVISALILLSGPAHAAGYEALVLKDLVTPVDSTNPLPVTGPTGTQANQVQGTAAAGTAAVGNPVQGGAIATTAAPTYASGFVEPLSLTTSGALRVTLLDPNNSANAPAVFTWGSTTVSLNTEALAVAALARLSTGATTNPAVDIVGALGTGVGTASVGEVPHSVALFTPAVTAGASTLTLASAKNLYTAYMTNTDTVVHWLWIVNTTSAPVNGAFSTGIASGNVQDCVEIAAGTTGSLGGLPIPEPFSAGIYMANSTTGCGAASSTLTLSTVGSMHLLAK